MPPAALTMLYESDPEIARLCVDFVPMLQRQIQVLIAGLAAGPAESAL